MAGHACKASIVLYVEDEENDALFMQLAFRHAGIEDCLRLVGDGREAIEYLSGAGAFHDQERYPVPKVVLLDLNLPVLSGFHVLEWLRSRPQYKDTPVVVFSSSSREEDQVKARELGANEFLPKPNSALRFREVVRELRQKWLGEEGR